MEPTLPVRENHEAFSLEVVEGVAHLQLCRPEQFNTLDLAFWRELPRFVDEIDADDSVRVLVLSSTGPHFSAGLDLAMFAEQAHLLEYPEPARMAENLRRTCLQMQAHISSLEHLRIPVLAAIQGGCIGGGLDLVCATDVRYCTDDAYFTVGETEIGMTADLGTLQRMPRLIPDGVIRELAYTGRRLTSDEALRLGFVNRVLPDARAMVDEVFEVARRIASHSPLAVAGCKEMINYTRDHPVEDGLRYVATWQAGMFRTGDLEATFEAKAAGRSAKYAPLLPVRSAFEH